MSRRRLAALVRAVAAPPYKRPGGGREARGVRPAVLLALCLSAGGCSTFGIGADDALVTGSISPQQVSAPLPEGEPPKGIAASDWVQAKLALDAALADPKSGASVPWENKATGASGTSTPLMAAKGDGCRDFRISIVDRSGDRWVQGQACRAKSGTVLQQVRLLERA